MARKKNPAVLGDLVHDPNLPPAVIWIGPEVLSLREGCYVAVGEFREHDGTHLIELTHPLHPQLVSHAQYDRQGALLVRHDHGDGAAVPVEGGEARYEGETWHYERYDGERVYGPGDDYVPVVKHDPPQAEDRVIDKQGTIATKLGASG